MHDKLVQFTTLLDKRAEGVGSAKCSRKGTSHHLRKGASQEKSATEAEQQILLIGAVLEAIYLAADGHNTIFCTYAMDTLLSDWVTFPRLIRLRRRTR